METFVESVLASLLAAAVLWVARQGFKKKLLLQHAWRKAMWWVRGRPTITIIDDLGKAPGEPPDVIDTGIPWEGDLGAVQESKPRLVRLRPIARRVNDAGKELEPEDDSWIEEPTAEGDVSILNTRTGHTKTLGRDHVHQSLSDPDNEGHGFLLLNSQITLRGLRVIVEPHWRR